MAPHNESLPAAPSRQLTLFDTTSIIVGIIIGSSVYVTAPMIAGNLPDTLSFLGVWLLGGVFALAGSLCYAELATALPADGGDYIFLSRAYGRPVGFLFAWCELWLVRPGAIGSLAYVFAQYADQLVPLGQYFPPLTRHAPMIYAAGATALITAANLLGVATGKWMQNILTLAKVLGLAVVIVVGFSVTADPVQPGAAAATVPSSSPETNWGLAMIFILYAYGGWNDMAFVSAEVKDPGKNILRALLLGTAVVTAIYLLINISFLHALGFDGVRGANALAADVVRLRWGDSGAKAVSLLVAISALGAVNGMTFTAARIYYALGTRHRLFAPLGVWSARFDGPIRALVLQGTVTLGLVIVAGLSAGGTAQEGFSTMANFTMPPFWFFLLLVALAVIVLRWREPNLPRPYRTVAFPSLPLIFVAGAAYMLWSSYVYARQNFAPQAYWTFAALGAGVVACAVDHLLGQSATE